MTYLVLRVFKVKKVQLVLKVQRDQLVLQAQPVQTVLRVKKVKLEQPVLQALKVFKV